MKSDRSDGELRMQLWRPAFHPWHGVGEYRQDIKQTKPRSQGAQPPEHVPKFGSTESLGFV